MIENLREHCRITNKPNEEQIDLMVVCSARSLQTAFLDFDEMWVGEDVYMEIENDTNAGQDRDY